MPVIDDWMEHHHHVRVCEDALHFSFEAATATGWKISRYRVLQTLCRRIKWLWRQVDAERAACAALCREAGCMCQRLRKARFRHDTVSITEHDPACPYALASRIEARGGHQPKSP